MTQLPGLALLGPAYKLNGINVFRLIEHASNINYRTAAAHAVCNRTITENRHHVLVLRGINL